MLKSEDVFSAGNGVYKAGKDFQLHFIIWVFFEKQKYYQNESKFKDIYSRNKLLSTAEDGDYIANLDE